ncbi:MAG: hypothetical protein LBO74_01950 [Candidatus Symbiothrix sp.]|jgi:predicted CopG family antitoxin|nr:hypothetical protein [Candidatus Symbiothrix sp.]
MKTLNISISDTEYNSFGLTKEKLAFSELINVISKQLSRLALNNSVELAEKYGLSLMTQDEISEEVKTIRKNAKNNP